MLFKKISLKKTSFKILNNMIIYKPLNLKTLM